MKKDTKIDRLFLKDGKPFITSSNTQFELGVNKTNPKFKLEDSYIVSGEDLIKMLPKLSKDITLCEISTNNGTKMYRFSSESELAELKELLKKKYDDKDKDLMIGYQMSRQEYENGMMQRIKCYESNIKEYQKKIKYLEDKIDEHNYYCMFSFNHIKVNYRDIK